MNISKSDLQWLLDMADTHMDGELYSYAGSNIQDDRARSDRIQRLVNQPAVDLAPETDEGGEPQMYLLSRDNGGEPVPLIVFRRLALAEKAQKLLQRGSGMVFEILPIPLED